MNDQSTMCNHLHNHILQACLNIFDIPSNILPVRFKSRLALHLLDLNPHPTARSLELQNCLNPHLYKFTFSPSTYHTKKVCVCVWFGRGGQKGQDSVDRSTEEKCLQWKQPSQTARPNMELQSRRWKKKKKKTMMADKSEETVNKRTATCNPTGITFTYASIYSL